MKCQCENALCKHRGKVSQDSSAHDVLEVLKPCHNEATYTVNTRYGPFKLCGTCMESARDFATHIYKGV